MTKLFKRVEKNYFQISYKRKIFGILKSKLVVLYYETKLNKTVLMKTHKLA